jgi:alkanesulfonate monooxygenase SsuD/methylene tetrahydromethanopterin reductase-like flavin-dependent oxidoreductase (luciferase family)
MALDRAQLGVGFAWHTHAWEDLLELVQRSESIGFGSAWIDGDVSMLGRRAETEVLDGWTTTIALLASTRNIAVGSMRLVHHWNAARLAQAGATAERLFPGRFRFLVSAGDRPEDAHFGLALAPAADRMARLDEALGAIRALWRGESVNTRGAHVRLDGARVRPTPPAGALPIWVAAQRPRMLEVVARHADVWDINLPPLPDRVAAAGERLEEACEALGRDASAIARSMWIFTRIDPPGGVAGALAEYRRLNPWFARIPDREICECLVVGRAEECAERLAALCAALRLRWPIVDLSGLEASASRATLEALASNF